jgi:hypothetical protein
MYYRKTSAAVAASVLVAAAVSGCATVTRGTQEVWTVNTVPSGAAVKTSNGYGCDDTPCTFKMDHRSTFDVTITKPGYRQWQGNVTHQFAAGGGAAFAGNVVLGGGVGMIVDTASGATQKLVPNPLNVTLEPVQVSGSAAPSSSPAVGSN